MFDYYHNYIHFQCFIAVFFNYLIVNNNNNNNNISLEKIWTWLRKGNLKRETESLLITA